MSIIIILDNNNANKWLSFNQDLTNLDINSNLLVKLEQEKRSFYVIIDEKREIIIILQQLMIIVSMVEFGLIGKLKLIGKV